MKKLNCLKNGRDDGGTRSSPKGWYFCERFMSIVLCLSTEMLKKCYEIQFMLILYGALRFFYNFIGMQRQLK